MIQNGIIPVLLLFLASVFAGSAGLAQGVAVQRGASRLPPAVIREIDHLARRQLEIDSVGGMTIGIVTDGGLVWTGSYGMADMSRHEPASRTTVYRIGSITKQFTALMLLQLVARGVVHLSDPADLYFPAIDSVRGRAPHAPPVTLVQLATMRSGLAQEPQDTVTYLKGGLAEWEHVLAAALSDTKYDAEPGTTWEYSNIGYATLGAALEQAAKRPYIEYVRDEILRPLGMGHTAFQLDSALSGNLATGYAMEQGRVDTATPAREHHGRGYKVPNGALYSTVDDLAKFVAFEMGSGPETVLSRQARKDNFSRLAWASPDLAQGYGIGFHASRRASLVAFGHPGSVAGYLSAAYFDPITRTGVIVLRNTDDKRFDVLNFCFAVLDKAAGARRR